jgi:hypothetical protein
MIASSVNPSCQRERFTYVLSTNLTTIMSPQHVASRSKTYAARCS